MAAGAHIPRTIRERFEVREWKHASAILRSDFPKEFKDIVGCLESFVLKTTDFTDRGGNKGAVPKRVDNWFVERGWEAKSWNTSIVVDDLCSESPTHEVDLYRNRGALEVEWNNKDPFFDRDLNNFRLLFDLRVISVGIVITKADDLRERILQIGGRDLFDKDGASTTWMNKLLPRIEGGGGGGCPLLVFGITPRCFENASGREE